VRERERERERGCPDAHTHTHTLQDQTTALSGYTVDPGMSQLGSSYGGCETDPGLCSASNFYASDQAGTSPFKDPSGHNPIYQGTLDAKAAVYFFGYSVY
jgi:hypothetical protein